VLQRWRGDAEGLPPDTADAARGRRAECARHCAELDRRAHARLLTELQLLYVALSRGRRRVFVFERDVGKRAALYAYLGSPVQPAGGGNAQPPVAVFDDAIEAEADESDGAETADGGKRMLSASAASDWHNKALSLQAGGLHAPAAAAFFKAANVHAGWRSTGAAVAAAADAAAALSQGAKEQALHMRAARALLSGRAYDQAAAQAHLAGHATLAADIERYAAAARQSKTQ